MHRLAVCLLLISTVLGLSKPSYCQEDLIPATPIGGEFVFAINFADIKWSEEDRRYLEGKTIEMYLDIGTTGVATFAEFGWLENQSIRDSLIAHIPSEPSFNPRINYGEKEATQYCFVMFFPNSNSELLRNGFMSPVPINSISEGSFDLYMPSKRGFGMYTAYFVNTFQGSISNHLATGVGLKGGYFYTFRTGTSLAIGGSITVNRVTNPISVSDTLTERYRVPVCDGLYFGIDQEIGKFHLYLDAIFTIIPVTRDFELDDNNYIPGTSYFGWAPGVFVSYSFDVFESTRLPILHEGKLRIPHYSFELYTGFRDMRINSPDLVGRMWEFGIVLRLSGKYLDAYRLSASNYTGF